MDNLVLAASTIVPALGGFYLGWRSVEKNLLSEMMKMVGKMMPKLGMAAAGLDYLKALKQGVLLGLVYGLALAVAMVFFALGDVLLAFFVSLACASVASLLGASAARRLKH